jgi:Uma2 family endonuclease
VVKTLESVDQRVILEGVSWETYESLLADHLDRSVPRFAYDRGVLEVMSPSVTHEMHNYNIALLVEVLAEELGFDVVGTGSTTFRREDLQRGFEPDSSFYVQNEARIRGKTEIDLAVDPPPDLLIEIDISRSSLDKLPIYAQLGIPEVWRHDGTKLLILRLEGAGYVEDADSGVLPPLTGTVLSGFIDECRTLQRRIWMRRVREWARQSGGQATDPRH